MEALLAAFAFLTPASPGNHNFGGAAFVVELPRGELARRMRGRLGEAIVRMGRWVRED